MAKYFDTFPKISYSFDGYKTSERITNVISRFALEQSLKENASIYYTHDVRDGDTPEILSAKLYGSPDKHWIIMMMNDIIDVGYDWPMDYRTLTRFIDAKYLASANSTTTGQGISWAQINIQAYYKVETTRTPSGSTIIKRFEIDANTYANTTISLNQQITLSDNNVIVINTTKETESYYDYELELNESKRQIKLLRPELVSQLEQEVRNAYL
jgi:hypothetical protein